MEQLIRKLPEECVNLILNDYFMSFTDEIWIPFSQNNKWKYKVNQSPYLHISLRNVCECKILNPIEILKSNHIKVTTIVLKTNNYFYIKYFTIVNDDMKIIVNIMMYYTLNFHGNEIFLWGTSFCKNKKKEVQIENGELIFIKEKDASELWREQWGYIKIPPLQIYM
jgi:hypothetical protein